MAIVSGDIKFYLSGGASNSNPNASIGGARSSTQWAGGVLHDLYDVVSGDENAASTVDYRCVYVRNENATGNTWFAPTFYISSEVAGGASIAIGLDPAGKNGTAAAPGSETTAPSGVSFSTPTTKAGSTVIAPDLAPNDYVALWFRRIAANSAPKDNDGATLAYAGDTGE